MKDKLYASKLAAQTLSLNASTLRKYATLLENFDYPIKRNEQGQRLYSEVDINKLIEFKSLVDKGWSLIKAAENVTIEFQKQSIEDVVEELMEKIKIIENKLGL